MNANERGLVAVRSASGRVLLHTARPPFGQTTLCGRYPAERYLPETEQLADDTPECQVCASTVARRAGR
jgi:hypothetical protein